MFIRNMFVVGVILVAIKMSCRCFFVATKKDPLGLLGDNFEATYMLLNIAHTNTVANINILYMNFIRCDVLVACPHLSEAKWGRQQRGPLNQTGAIVGREHHRTACRFARILS